MRKWILLKYIDWDRNKDKHKRAIVKFTDYRDYNSYPARTLLGRKIYLLWSEINSEHYLIQPYNR